MFNTFILSNILSILQCDFFMLLQSSDNNPMKHLANMQFPHDMNFKNLCLLTPSEMYFGICYEMCF